MESFANRLSEALIVRKMTAAELSRRIGVNEGTISNYKKGVYVPKQRRLEIISEVLNVSISWLLGNDVPMNAPAAPTEIISSLPPDVQELAQQIGQLDSEDRAVIRGEVRAMLRAEKYQKSAQQDA